jgi:hypothetical protein
VARTAARGSGIIKALAALAFAAPLLVLVAAMGVRTGVLPVETGYDLLTLKVAWWLSFAGAAAGVLALVLGLRDLRRTGVVAAVALLVGLGTLGVFVWQKGRLASGPGENVSTDLVEVPGFGAARSDAGGGPAVGGAACPGAQPVMTQIAPESAAWALQEAGFALGGTGVARADGSRNGFWFGFTHDAVIRIRPGRTDIRVAARDGRPHGGEACRLAARISELLRSRP